MKNIKRKISCVLSSLMMLGTPSLNYVNVQAMDPGNPGSIKMGWVFNKTPDEIKNDKASSFTVEFANEDKPKTRQSNILNLLTYAVAKTNPEFRVAKLNELISKLTTSLTKSNTFYLSNGTLLHLNVNNSLEVVTVDSLFPGLLDENTAKNTLVVLNIGDANVIQPLVNFPNGKVKGKNLAQGVAVKMGIKTKLYENAIKNIKIPYLSICENQGLEMDSQGKLFKIVEGTKKYLTLKNPGEDEYVSWGFDVNPVNKYGLDDQLMGKLGINIPKVKNPPLDPNKKPPIGPNKKPPIDPNKKPPIGPNKKPPIDPNKKPPKKYDPTPSKPEPSFFSKYKTALITTGVVATAAGAGFGYYRYSARQLEKMLKKGPKKAIRKNAKKRA